MVIEIMHYADELPSDEEIINCQRQLPPHIKIELKLYKEWLAEQQRMGAKCGEAEKCEASN